MNMLDISRLLDDLLFAWEKVQMLFENKGKTDAANSIRACHDQLKNVMEGISDAHKKTEPVKSALETMSEGVKIHPDAKRGRFKALQLIPDDTVITGAMKLFAWLTAFEDDKGKRPYQLIVEKGECPAPAEYYAARQFFLKKSVTVTKDDGKSVDIELNVTLVAVSSDAFPEREVTFKIPSEALKGFSDIPPS